MSRILKLNKGDKVTIVNSNNNGVLIENRDNVLNVKEINNQDETIYIKSLTDSEIISYALTILLENNSTEIKINKSNKKIITQLLENQFNNISGNIKNDVIDMEFQAITYYEK